jgi:type I restriction enzyme M protein
MTKNNNSPAPIGFKSNLWRAADALRSNMGTAEFRHIAIGLVSLSIH